MNLNKFKTLTAAVALAATAPVMAVIDMEATTDQVIKYADETKGTVDGNGRYTLANAGNRLDVVGDALVGTPVSSSIYYRYTLSGAVFGAAPSLSQATRNAADNAAGAAAITTAAGTASIVGGGASQDTFVAFRVNTPAADRITPTMHATMIAASYDVAPGGTATVTFSVHSTGSEAVNNTNALASSVQNLTTISAAYVDAVTPCSATATVASGFTAFGTKAAAAPCPAITDGDTLAVLGVYTYADVSAAGWYNAADGAATADADVAADTQVIKVAGDVEFGVFKQGTNATCAAGNTDLTKAADNLSASSAAVGTEADRYVCLELSGLADGETIGKGDYTIQLMTDMAAPSGAASITYDTTTVEAPYITTYEGYNQRIFIDNRGAVAAFYSTTFTTEAGVTATAGTAATGTLPANTMSVVKVSDLVTFTGGSRGSATMEIEAQDANIWVTTQIVDLGTGMTDTLVLN